MLKLASKIGKNKYLSTQPSTKSSFKFLNMIYWFKNLYWVQNPKSPPMLVVNSN